MVMGYIITRIPVGVMPLAIVMDGSTFRITIITIITTTIMLIGGHMATVMATVMGIVTATIMVTIMVIEMATGPVMHVEDTIHKMYIKNIATV